MAIHDYHLESRWRVRGGPEEVFAILADPEQLPGWWPAAFREVRREPGDKSRLTVLSKGFLPYRLRWQARLREAHRPSGYSFEVTGDFTGEGSWSVQQDGACVTVRFDWRVRVHRPLLRWLSYLLKPLLVANHRWAMCRGQEALQRRLGARGRGDGVRC
jgi:hypothetical protein